MGLILIPNLFNPAFVMTNPLLLTFLPLSQWNVLNHFCGTQHVSLPISQDVRLKGEGRSIDLLLMTGKSDFEMIGLLYMERFMVTTSEELENAIRQGGLHPEVVNLQTLLAERDIVFCYYEWFENLDGGVTLDWKQVHSGLVHFIHDFSALVAS